MEFLKFISSTTSVSFINNKCSSSKFTSNNIPTNNTKYSKRKGLTEKNKTQSWGGGHTVFNCILEINYEKESTRNLNYTTPLVRDHQKSKLNSKNRNCSIEKLNFKSATEILRINLHGCNKLPILPVCTSFPTY